MSTHLEALLDAARSALAARAPAELGKSLASLADYVLEITDTGYDRVHSRWSEVRAIFERVDVSIFTRGGPGTSQLAHAVAKANYFRQLDLSIEARLELLHQVRQLLAVSQYEAALAIDIERAELLAYCDDPLALDLCKDALACADQIENQRTVAQAHLSSAHVQIGLDKKREARASIDVAIQKYEALGSKHALANAFRLQAHISLALDDVVGASVFTGRAIELYKQTGDSVGEAHTLLTRAEVLIKRGRFDDAITHFDDAVRLYEVASLKTSQGDALRMRGFHYARTNRPREAVRDFEQARSFLVHSPDANIHARTMVLLGRARVSLGEPEAAIKCLDEIEELAAKIGRAKKRIDVLVDAARIAKSLPTPDRARMRRCCDVARVLAKNIGDKEREAAAKDLSAFAGPDHSLN
jgi:tetratricopeptide (TPR) repeat protein